MLFNSIEYLIFLAFTVLAFFLLPHKYRWVLLLGASYFFYLSFKIEYIILLLFSTVITYFATISIDRTESERRQTIYLALCLAGNLFVFFYFKYLEFFTQVLSDALAMVNITYSPGPLNIILPIGISFYTFQIIGYAIDVYLGVYRAEKNPGKFSLFVAFFPQLISGPIERARNLLVQFSEKKTFNADLFKAGIKLITWGLFKKLVIADRVGMYVGLIYSNPELYNGIQLIMATYLFGLQVYCDFSGYIDMARGSAMLMGFRLHKNFDRPFFARNLTNYFTRWHITLFQWFTDYIYTPLAIRWRAWKIYGALFAIFITFIISGFWHGSSGNYIAWGAFYGIALSFEKLTENRRKKIFGMLPQSLAIFLGIFITFHINTLSNTLFATSNFQDAYYVFTHLFDFNKIQETLGPRGGAQIGRVPPLYYAVIPALILIFVEIRQEFFGKKGIFWESKYPFLRYLSYVAIVIIILTIGVFDGGQFIYFQF
ncbi:MAG: MBOAT family protein [Chitinophagales bacterium]|nr:MBOAT family protein [Chitinophagales bacterium]